MWMDEIRSHRRSETLVSDDSPGKCQEIWVATMACQLRFHDFATCQARNMLLPCDPQAPLTMVTQGWCKCLDFVNSIRDLAIFLQNFTPLDQTTCNTKGNLPHDLLNMATHGAFHVPGP